MHDHKKCVKTVAKWAAVAYAAHLMLHVLAFAIAPMLGWLSLALF